jgi:hypothetical protein
MYVSWGCEEAVKLTLMGGILTEEMRHHLVVSFFKEGLMEW